MSNEEISKRIRGLCDDNTKVEIAGLLVLAGQRIAELESIKKVQITLPQVDDCEGRAFTITNTGDGKVTIVAPEPLYPSRQELLDRIAALKSEIGESFRSDIPPRELLMERIASLKILCEQLHAIHDTSVSDWPEETQKLWRENMSE